LPWVNGLLRDIIRDKYIPLMYWTSDARSRFGHKPFPPGDSKEDDDVSSFTVPDKTGWLQTFLKAYEFERAERLAPKTVFHIQVVFSRGDVSTPFSMPARQVEKVY